MTDHQPTLFINNMTGVRLRGCLGSKPTARIAPMASRCNLGTSTPLQTFSRILESTSQSPSPSRYSIPNQMNLFKDYLPDSRFRKKHGRYKREKDLDGLFLLKQQRLLSPWHIYVPLAFTPSRSPYRHASALSLPTPQLPEFQSKAPLNLKPRTSPLLSQKNHPDPYPTSNTNPPAATASLQPKASSNIISILSLFWSDSESSPPAAACASTSLRRASMSWQAVLVRALGSARDISLFEGVWMGKAEEIAGRMVGRMGRREECIVVVGGGGRRVVMWWEMVL